MLIDCDRCEMRNLACDDCVVSTLLGSTPGSGVNAIDDGERAALGVLAESGLVPPLRLVMPADAPAGGATSADDAGGRSGGRSDGADVARRRRATG